MGSSSEDNVASKSFKIFEKDEPLETIFVDLEKNVHPLQQKLISKYGKYVRNLHITCKHTQEQRHLILTEILKKCPNLEKIKISFYHFKTVGDPKALSCVIDPFHCPVTLERLFSLEFKAILTLEEVSDEDEIVPKDKKSKKEEVPKVQLRYKAFSFYLDIFTKIIIASRSLKHLAIYTYKLHDFVSLITRDDQVSDRLRQLQTLLLVNCPVPSMTHVLYQVPLLLYHVLVLMTSSLEELHIGGVPWTDLETFPRMAKLKTLSMQWECDTFRMVFSKNLVPRLNKLILYELDQSKYPVYLDFQWPFRKITHQIGLHELEWDDNMKSLKFDSIENTREIDNFFENEFNVTELSGHGMQPVNLILYINNEPSFLTMAWIGHLFIQLFRGFMNVQTCFIDLTKLTQDQQDWDFKEHFLARCRKNGETPALQRVVIRVFDDQPPEEHDLTLKVSWS